VHEAGQGERRIRIAARLSSVSLRAEVEALNQLFSAGRLEEVVDGARRMTAAHPQLGFGWQALGAALGRLGRVAEALGPVSRAAELAPLDPMAHSNLGVTLQSLGRSGEAEAAYRRALQLAPGVAAFLNNLGALLQVLGRHAEATDCLQLAVQAAPDFAAAHNSLGASLQSLGMVAQAEASFRRALEIAPDYAEAHNNLGNLLMANGAPAQAEASYRRALELNPRFVAAAGNLGNALVDQDRILEALGSYGRALEIDPGHAETYDNLGGALQDLGRFDEAQAAYRAALRFAPEFAKAHSDLLLCMNFTCEDPAHYLAQARTYGQMVSAMVAQRFDAWRCADGGGRLRVGFVSGDLREHPVGYFLENLVQNLDPDRFELHAYPPHDGLDTLAMRLRPRFAAWTPLPRTDGEAARRIHDDGIHVLFDLSGHTAENRLPVFAWKPAPVQVSWLGYFASTGVAEIDYFLADPVLVPEHDRAHFSERVWHLPQTRLCFSAPMPDIAVAALPALYEGTLTFGCFNTLSKLGDPVLALWAQLLARLPGSRLFLKARQLNEAAVRDEITRRLAAHGVEPTRLILEGSSPRGEYLAAYNRVDIALDPFPYTGATTTMEALWMGVPVLTLAGHHLLARQGASLLSNAGLPQWIASDAEDFLRRGVAHAADLHGLARLRLQLRAQISASPLLDGQRFARDFAAALEQMWAHHKGVVT
jgi:predicted O-linked N-acetylglucosamine transferase (SPINDLY family)